MKLWKHCGGVSGYSKEKVKKRKRSFGGVLLALAMVWILSPGGGTVLSVLAEETDSADKSGEISAAEEFAESAEDAGMANEEQLTGESPAKQAEEETDAKQPKQEPEADATPDEVKESDAKQPTKESEAGETPDEVKESDAKQPKQEPEAGETPDEVKESDAKQPELAVNLTSNAAADELEYDTNNVLFTANVTKNGSAYTGGTVQFYLNGAAVGTPVNYDTSSYYYRGFYKVICSADNGTSPYFSMGGNTVYAVYTYDDGTTVTSNELTVTLVKQDISRYLTKGRTIGDLYYNGQKRNVASIGWHASEAWITKDLFELTATRDGQPITPEYSEMTASGTTFNFIASDPGVYVYTATVKEDNPHYWGSITTDEKEILSAQRISVTITWGEMSFTYKDGDWNPDTHTSAAGSWTDNGSGWVNVANDGSDVPVNVTCTYTPKTGYTNISGSLTDGTDSITNPIPLKVNEEKKMYLALTGKPEAALDRVQLGTITVGIEKGGK